MAGVSYTLDNSTSTNLVLTETVNGAITGNLYFTGSIDNVWGTGSATTSNWSVNSNGLPDAASTGSTTDVHFYATNATTSNLATSLGGAPYTIRTLTVDGTSLNSPSTPVSIAPGGAGGILTITPAASTAGISVGAGGNLTITAPVVLGAARPGRTGNTSGSNTLTVNGTVTNGGNNLTVTGSGDVAIGGAIGNGAGSLTKSGAGTLSLSAANTYTGGTNLLGGTLAVGVDNSLPTAGDGHLWRRYGRRNRGARSLHL